MGLQAYQIEAHSQCGCALQSARDKVDHFQTVAYPMRNGGIWEVRIYFASGDEPVEWFGCACCADAATAMALEDFAE